ncbi:MAG: hypothetical protein JWO25_2940, partial [Alphaproteobacteria bacterium]|nr:hypothetical protein [Alphaproteobacteria bacterium]
MISRAILWLVLGSVAVGGCSSRPREFTPALAAPASSPAEFDAAYATCQRLFLAGKLNSTARGGSAAAGAGAGLGTAAVGGTA